jgi:hypothetical protein
MENREFGRGKNKKLKHRGTEGTERAESREERGERREEGGGKEVDLGRRVT